jgi:hypothetical protein
MSVQDLKMVQKTELPLSFLKKRKMVPGTALKGMQPSGPLVV